MQGKGILDFKNSNFSFSRSLGSYAKIQSLYSPIIRNRSRQLNKSSILEKQYINIGCGPNLDETFINLDYEWRPGLDLCWDLTTGIPIENSTMTGVYTEHCLEHIIFEDCQRALKDFFRVLRPGGLIRIVVPDAELYIDMYTKSKNGSLVDFPFVSAEERESGFSPIMSVNRMFRNHGHLFAYDFDVLFMMLSKEGFINISKESFMNGRNKQLLIDSESRRIESLYLEAEKPI